MALSSNPLIHVGAFLWQSWSSHCSFSLLITFLVSLIMPFWLFMFILHTYYKTLISSWTKLIASLFPNSPLPSVLYILFRCNHSSRRWNALCVVFFLLPAPFISFATFSPFFHTNSTKTKDIWESRFQSIPWKFAFSCRILMFLLKKNRFWYWNCRRKI